MIQNARKSYYFEANIMPFGEDEHDFFTYANTSLSLEEFCDEIKEMLSDFSPDDLPCAYVFMVWYSGRVIQLLKITLKSMEEFEIERTEND